MKKLLRLSISALLLSTASAMAADQETIVTLYNSETTGETLAVLRQVPRKAELFSCQTKYTGSLKDFEAVTKFFNEGLSSVFRKRTNCHKYDIISGNDFKVSKRKILNGEGNPVRYIFTQAGSFKEFSAVSSDVAAWSVDVNDGLGVAPGDVFLTGARVNHTNQNNPTISSFRNTFKLSGMAQILHPTIED